MNTPSDSALPNERGFEQWYVENAFDYERSPLGSQECSIARKAWHAALDAAQPAAAGELPEAVAIAKHLHEWMANIKPNGDFLPAGVVCDYAGKQYFIRDMAAQIADQLRAAVAEKDREIRVTENHLAEAMRTIAEQDKETERLEAVVAGYRRDAEESIDLLNYMFSEWESGSQCYEGGDIEGLYLGQAFRIGDIEHERICDLLSRLRPRAAIANLGSGDGKEGKS